jgi:hypothetical protein
MTKNDLNLISQTESQNGWIFNCPNKVNDKVYYGTIDLTYDLSVKPTLNEVIPNEFLDLGQGSTPYHWSNPPTIDDIKWRFEHKYDAEDPTLWYNTYRLIFWNESDILDIQSRDATNHAVTVEVTSNGETYYNNTSTIVFTNIAWDN